MNRPNRIWEQEMGFSLYTGAVAIVASTVLGGSIKMSNYRDGAWLTGLTGLGGA